MCVCVWLCACVNGAEVNLTLAVTAGRSSWSRPRSLFNIRRIIHNVAMRVGCSQFIFSYLRHLHLSPCHNTNHTYVYTNTLSLIYIKYILCVHTRTQLQLFYMLRFSWRYSILYYRIVGVGWDDKSGVFVCKQIKCVPQVLRENKNNLLMIFVFSFFSLFREKANWTDLCLFHFNLTELLRHRLRSNHRRFLYETMCHRRCTSQAG